MLNINITKVKGYSYSGYILDSELTDEQLKCLGLTRDAEYVSEIYVEGDFVVEWDDDIAMPQIENCQVHGGLNGKTWPEMRQVRYTDLSTRIETISFCTVKVPAKYTLDLDLEQLNLEIMENDVSEWDDGNWAVDRISSQIDAAYDSYMDR